ncbi:MAG TPA: zinc ribbon domain-containing protein [Terriglobales bacterium]|nr:zinc ribbon domain-containing protein [Terriglobales bacterium]
MEDKNRCQSCGMPIATTFQNLGTEADGSLSKEYCLFCFKGGSFTQPDLKVQDMIKMSIENMTDDLRMPLDRATELANNVIPRLGRWQA